MEKQTSARSIPLLNLQPEEELPYPTHIQNTYSSRSSNSDNNHVFNISHNDSEESKISSPPNSQEGGRIFSQSNIQQVDPTVAKFAYPRQRSPRSMALTRTLSNQSLLQSTLNPRIFNGSTSMTSLTTSTSRVNSPRQRMTNNQIEVVIGSGCSSPRHNSISSPRSTSSPRSNSGDLMHIDSNASIKEYQKKLQKRRDDFSGSMSHHNKASCGKFSWLGGPNAMLIVFFCFGIGLIMCFLTLCTTLSNQSKASTMI